MTSQKSKYTVEIDTNKQIPFHKFQNFDCILRDVVLRALEINNYLQGVYNISLMICDDDYIADLNFQYRGKNYATNVLSFEGDEMVHDGIYLLGDIAISVPCIKREAKEQGKTFRTHFIHMFIHGVLHIMGFDHMTPDEAAVMEKMEDEILAYLVK